MSHIEELRTQYNSQLEQLHAQLNKDMQQVELVRQTINQVQGALIALTDLEGLADKGSEAETLSEESKETVDSAAEVLEEITPEGKASER